MSRREEIAQIIDPEAFDPGGFPARSGAALRKAATIGALVVPEGYRLVPVERLEFAIKLICAFKDMQARHVLEGLLAGDETRGGAAMLSAAPLEGLGGEGSSRSLPILASNGQPEAATDGKGA